MYYEESQIPTTLIGTTPTTATDFALKTSISNQRQSFSKASFVNMTEISSGSSNWAVVEEFGAREVVIDVNAATLANTEFKEGWVKSDAEAIISFIEETTQTINEIKKDSVLSIIEEIRKHKSIPHSEQIANRLYQLNDDVLDDYPDSGLISPDSLLDYYQFLKLNQNLTIPSISVIPDGNIWIQWETSINHHFSLEFKGQSEVIFVVFSPDRIIPTKINRVSGKGTIYSIMIQAQPYDISSWVLIKEKVA